MSGQLGLRKDSHPTKLKRRTEILVNLSFTELYSCIVKVTSQV